MKTHFIVMLMLVVAACGARAQTSLTTSAASPVGAVLRPIGGQTDTTLAVKRQTMQQAEAAYNTALTAAAPDLPALDAQIAQARDTLMNLQMQRQSMVRAAERSIADVANALDAARDDYMQSSRAAMTARQASIAAQRASAATAGTTTSAAVQP